MDCKLYVITHSDLPLKYQLPQSNHAAMEFAAQYPDEFRAWHKNSNSIIVLNAQNELKLLEFAERLKNKGIKFSEFREPDIGNELTAIAICPGPEVKRLCSGLPLAGKRINEGAEERLSKKFETVEAMKSCLQTSNQNMIQHGESVRDHLFDLIEFLRNPHYVAKNQWKFPLWLLSHGQQILNSLPPKHILEKYALWHDCGKPFCRTVDEEGKSHYPNHAQKSSEIFRSLYPEQEKTAWLIEHDMDIHLLEKNQIEEFCKSPHALALLLTGVAEIHSNAKLFGGITSTSFKIKWKHLDKIGAAICQRLFDKN